MTNIVFFLHTFAIFSKVVWFIEREINNRLIGKFLLLPPETRSNERETKKYVNQERDRQINFIKCSFNRVTNRRRQRFCLGKCEISGPKILKRVSRKIFFIIFLINTFKSLRFRFSVISKCAQVIFTSLIFNKKRNLKGNCRKLGVNWAWQSIISTSIEQQIGLRIDFFLLLTFKTSSFLIWNFWTNPSLFLFSSCVCQR